MDIEQLITALEGLSGPDRRVDAMIGEVAGWERHLEPMNDNRDQAEAVFWLKGGVRYRRIPYFTMSVDAAMLAVQALLGETDSGGFTWRPRGPSWAQIDDGPESEGANGAIALCIAALRRKKQRN